MSMAHFVSSNPQAQPKGVFTSEQWHREESPSPTISRDDCSISFYSTAVCM